MGIDIPECRRCCFCLPIRQGVLSFGYISLIFTLLCISLELYLGYDDDLSDITMMAYRGNSFFVRTWLALLLYFIDVAFNIVLLIGAHMKRVRLLTVYYYYGITTTFATFLTILLIDFDVLNIDAFYLILEVGFIFFAVVLHIYMLFLVRSMIRRLQQNTGLTFVNHVSEVVVHPPIENTRNLL